ncbi:hypothetical protein Tco_1119802, partial [Tanacetum coccineum]
IGSIYVSIGSRVSTVSGNMEMEPDIENMTINEYWYRIFTKGQKKTKLKRTKPSTDLERARKTEVKGSKGLKTELKRKFPDRLDDVCAINEVKTKSKSTPGYGIGKGI